MDFDYAIVTLDNWFSNKTVVFISKKIYLFSIWFLIGIYSYLYLIPNSIITKINKLSFFELFIIIFIIFMTLMLIETFLLEPYISVNSKYLYMVKDNISNSSPSSNNAGAKPSDAVIMTTWWNENSSKLSNYYRKSWSCCRFHCSRHWGNYS